MKKLRQSDVWKSRWFVLSAEYLSYFKSYQVRRKEGGLGERRGGKRRRKKIVCSLITVCIYSFEYVTVSTTV